MATTRLTLAVVVALAVVAALHQTTVEAQQLHVVGDGMGWIVPPGGPFAYAAWAATQTFTVGDILMFNFITGQQDVAMVTQEAFDACNSTNPIYLYTTSPVNITLPSGGMYYFIGTMTEHCFLGQKLAINVTGASAGPTTSPATPSPPRAPVTYVVGDVLGWLVPPGGPIAYSTWAYDKTFLVGDSLVFNFVNGTQDVAVVTEAVYDSCDTTTTITVYATSPAKITLTAPGAYYFTSTYPQHCFLGQKLTITVAGTSGTSPSASPPSPRGSGGDRINVTPSSSAAPSKAMISFFFVTFLSVATSFLV